MLSILSNSQFWLLVAVLAVTGYHVLEPRFGKKACVSIVTVILACVGGLRTWWFGDLIKYYTQYRSCNGDGWVDAVFGDWINVGLRLFFRLMGAVGISYDICIFLIATLVAVALGLLVYRYSPSPLWSYLMYICMGFLLFTYSGLKQAIAMSFVIFAMFGILENKPVKFLVWTAVAGLFHFSAFIFLFAYPFSKKKVDVYYFLILLAALAVIYVFRDTIVGWMSDAYYGNEGKYTASGLIGGRFLMMLFMMGLALFFRPLRRDDVIYSKVFTIMVIAAGIQIFSVYDNVFTRLADYYYQFVVLFVPLMLQTGESRLAENPELVGKIKVWDKRIYYIAFAAVFAFSVWYYTGQLDTWEAQDFRFCWQVHAHQLYGA